MQKLPEVETAKTLMLEAMSWSVMKWLREKKRVRQTADRANAVLDELSRTLRTHWPEELRTAYDALDANDDPQSGKRSKQASSAQASLLAKKIKAADDEAFKARMEAEKTFDDAEKQLSTSMAREGCRKAIHGWELHEKAIRQTESAVDK